MFKKTIKYTDFDGKEQVKDFWFHLSNAKLAVLSASIVPLQARAERLMKSEDNAAILEELRSLIKLACGIRSDDGQRFIQTEEAQSELLDSPAFDELLFELFVGNNAVEFFNALVPPEQQKQIEALAIKQGTKVPDPFKEPEDNRPAYQKENRHPTSAELQAMSKDELVEAMAWKAQNDK